MQKQLNTFRASGRESDRKAIEWRNIRPVLLCSHAKSSQRDHSSSLRNGSASPSSVIDPSLIAGSRATKEVYPIQVGCLCSLQLRDCHTGKWIEHRQRAGGSVIWC
jgi:hypothetical protein